LKAVVSDRDPGAAFRGFAGAGVGRPPPQPVIHPKKQKSFLGDPGQEAGATQRPALHLGGYCIMQTRGPGAGD